VDDLIRQAQEQLGKEVFAVMWEQGRQLISAEALVQARKTV